jgi:hypothetical protein
MPRHRDCGRRRRAAAPASGQTHPETASSAPAASARQTSSPSAPARGPINLGGSIVSGSAEHVVAISPTGGAPVHPSPQLVAEGLSPAAIASEQQQAARQ